MRCPGEHLRCHVCGRVTSRIDDRDHLPVCMTHDTSRAPLPEIPEAGRFVVPRPA